MRDKKREVWSRREGGRSERREKEKEREEGGKEEYKELEKMGEEEENKTQFKEALAERGPFAGDSGEGRGGQGDLTRRQV